VSGAPKHGGATSSPGAGGLGVKTPSESRETGGGRFYALKTPSRAAIPMASRTLTEPVPLVRLPLANPSHRHEGTGGGTGEADARDSVRRPRVTAAALLSMGHIATRPEPLLRIWTEGSRVDVPAGDSLKPDLPSMAPGSATVRGTISEFSDKSRRRLLRELHTRKRDAESYTMALTLPGDFSHLPAETVISHFRTLQRRFSRTWSKRGVSLDWKRELQERMALHYHLMLYGLEDPATREEVRAWLVLQWNALCCSGMEEKAREHHRWFHAREENFQLVRDMAGSFAKYLGKAEDASGALPGRWWGSWNKPALPVSPVSVVCLAPKAKAMIRRIANKLRLNRMHEGKHRQICAKIGLVGHLSRWQLQCFRMGYTRQGFRAQGYMTSPNSYSPTGKEIAEMFDDSAGHHGLRFGKSRFKGVPPSTAPIVLLGKHSPASMIRAVEWVYGSLGIPSELLDETSHKFRQAPPLTPPPGFVRRPRQIPSPVQLDLIPIERIQPSDFGF